ncbi:MAG: hypothetical protein JST09_07605 [Bacteroidetes bacterium]|nr:hypothetical protein [Bacteroidota bacterium]MBS1610948.1 hypothetical protein [Bacteroidota bacterium]
MAAACIFFLLILNGCQKNARLTTDNKLDLSEKTSNSTVSALVVPTCTGLNDVMPAVNYDNDSIERPTVLGVKHVNPYLIPNMQKAYANLGITSQSITVTNLYVRFLPSSAAQLGTLDSVMNAQGLDLFDTPMDYDVTEGDYYQDPSIPMEQVTWQYAVVPPNFIAPSGITYQVLAQIHIPGDNYTAVETEAERLAAVQDCAGGAAAAAAVPSCPRCQVWSASQNKCVPYTCPPGYVCDDGGAGGCILQPAPVDPPPPATDAAIPAGNIYVFDTQIPTNDGSHWLPVRNVRVVVKRWFKIQRLYTDNFGHFTATRRFKHKVKIVVKFQNNDASIRAMRENRLWQMTLPTTKDIGVYSSDKSTVNYVFQKSNAAVNRIANRFWAVATVHNCVQEYKDYATADHIGLPAGKIKIFVTHLSDHGSGSTPLFCKRNLDVLPQEYFYTNLASTAASIVGGFNGAVQVLRRLIDVTISYNGRPRISYANFASDDLKTTTYHELAHVAEYAQLGTGWYNNFFDAVLTQTIAMWGSTNSPYGTGANATTTPIIALGESWPYHIGHWFADKQYGQNSSTAGEQGIDYNNNEIPGIVLSCHLIALENFDPARTTAPFGWIPKGLFYDMMDTRNDKTSIPLLANIDDQVSGYTNQQFFSAFNSSITTLQGFRANLLSLNGNSQATQVTNLFTQYGY